MARFTVDRGITLELTNLVARNGQQINRIAFQVNKAGQIAELKMAGRISLPIFGIEAKVSPDAG